MPVAVVGDEKSCLMKAVPANRKRNDRGRPTARDVARLAGVSLATVSRALSNPDLVREDKVTAVRKAAEKLKYVMHGVGRALSSRQTGLIGVILPTLEHAMWAKTIDALQRAVTNDGYTLAIACSDLNPDAELELARRFIEHGTDGILLCGRSHRPELMQLFQNVAIPHVFMWAFEPSTMGKFVGFDDRKAVTLVVDHLVKLGHREIGTITGPTNSEWQQTRRQWLVSEFQRHNLRLRSEWSVSGPISFETGRNGARELLSQSERPTAIICGQDILAVGVTAMCMEMGISIPADVSLTGFEDLDLVSNINPPLTTVRFPAAEIGTVSGAEILRAIRGDVDSGQIELPISLVIRNTTASPSKKNSTLM